ncbi:MAG TPA: ATP-binding protein [Planctomycetota bacterium]
MRKTPRGIGLNLAFRLYLVLIAIVGPAMLIYYIFNQRTIENLHGREVGDLIQTITRRMEDWLVSTGEPPLIGDRERESLAREMGRIVDQTNGAVEGIALFVVSGRELDYVTSHGSSAPTRPTLEDTEAAGQHRIRWGEVQSGTVRLYAYSIPLFRRGDLAGLLNLRVIPDRIGLASRLPELRAILLLGAGAMLVALVIGVVLFFHIAVRRPISELTGAMGEAADGNLATLVRSRGGEFGWLSASYNRMMRRLKSSVDENRQLLDQIRRFNEELQEKIRAATEELAAKNLQLQEVNERLFTTQRQMTTMEKLATLGQVATTIAHELGTPLNAISGHLQLLLEGGAGDPRLVDRLKIIDGQVDRLTAIVKNVLRAMRVPPPRFEPVRMEEMIRREAELIEPVARKRKVAVELKVPPDLPVIPADPDQVEQILLNLYTNALDAMKEGGRLSVSARVVAPEEAAQVSPGAWAPIENSTYLRVDVADTGVGMTEEMMARAFEPFFSSRSNDGNSAEPSGMGVGLGLAICREIVRNHKGEIVAASQVGRGTTFTFFLPVDNDNILIHK